MQPAVVPAEYLFLLVRFGCVLSCRQKLLNNGGGDGSHDHHLAHRSASSAIFSALLGVFINGNTDWQICLICYYSVSLFCVYLPYYIAVLPQCYICLSGGL